jgi:DNA-directed RNA polymerase sigma subunit (sigma70/sigma32)
VGLARTILRQPDDLLLHVVQIGGALIAHAQVRRQELGRGEPTLTELAGAAGVELVEAAHALNLTSARRSCSGDDLLLERLPHPDQPLPDEEAYVSERAERIDAVLGTLREREALVLRRYYGLGDAPR